MSVRFKKSIRNDKSSRLCGGQGDSSALAAKRLHLHEIAARVDDRVDEARAANSRRFGAGHPRVVRLTPRAKHVVQIQMRPRAKSGRCQVRPRSLIWRSSRLISISDNLPSLHTTMQTLAPDAAAVLSSPRHIAMPPSPVIAMAPLCGSCNAAAIPAGTANPIVANPFEIKMSRACIAGQEAHAEKHVGAGIDRNSRAWNRKLALAIARPTPMTIPVPR